MVLYELHHHGVIAIGGATGRFFAEGSRGIDVFFVISGFALAYPALSVLRADGRAGLDLGRYAVRRVARVVPATWIVIAFLAAAPGFAALVPHPTYAVFVNALPPASAIFGEIFFLQAPPSAPDAFWAVAVAVRWYVVFPALLLLWTKSQRAFIGLGAALVVLEGPLHLHGFGFGELPAFMLGIVAADWRVRHFGFARWSLYLTVAAAMLGFALEPLFGGPLFAAAPFGGDNIGWQAAAFFLLTGIGHSARAERAFDRAFFATAGSVAFAVALVIEPVTSVARPFVQHLSTSGARALGRPLNPQTGGFTGRLSRALAPGTPVANVLEIVFVALCVLVAGLVLYRLVDRAVFERDPRMRFADRLEPLLSRLYALMRTTGVLVIGKPAEELRFEASATGASEFYAPPPRGDDTGLASVTKRTGSPADLEQEMIQAKKRLADRTTAMFADAEYEANRARGVVTSSPGAIFQPPPGLLDASSPVFGEPRDVWQKPRNATPDPAVAPAPETPAQPPIAPSRPVVFETRPDSEEDEKPYPPPRPSAPAASSNPPFFTSPSSIPPLFTSPSAPPAADAAPPVPPVRLLPERDAGESPGRPKNLSTTPPAPRPRSVGPERDVAEAAPPEPAVAGAAPVAETPSGEGAPPEVDSLKTVAVSEPRATSDATANGASPAFADAEPAPPEPRAVSAIRFKIGGGPPGTPPPDEKSP